MEDLIKQRDTLVLELEEGQKAIEAAKAKGQDVSQWEQYWINDLLAHYERVCDAIRRLENPVLEMKKPEVVRDNWWEEVRVG